MDGLVLLSNGLACEITEWLLLQGRDLLVITDYRSSTGLTLIRVKNVEDPFEKKPDWLAKIERLGTEVCLTVGRNALSVFGEKTIDMVVSTIADRFHFRMSKRRPCDRKIVYVLW